MREQSHYYSLKQTKRVRGGETKSMKKKISSLLVFTLVLTLLVPAFAFAAVPSDVKSTNYEEAVAKLVSLGVVNGYPDGTFRPDQPITRAEFAKIVAYAGGFAKAAELLGPQSTQFKDVNANSYGWASGYIAVGANKGYFKGYNDGTFRPAKQVTYAEVLTVLLRVLGYNDNLIGNWPSDYIIQATALGITDGVTVTSNGLATRGAVAQLTSATLDQNIVYYDKDLLDFVEKKDSNQKTIKLISFAFDTSFTDAVVYSPSLSGDNNDKVSLLVNGAVKEYTAKDLYITGGKSLADLWGHNVEVLLDGSNIKFINDTQDTADVVTGSADKNVTVSNSVYTITVSDKKYDFANGATVYLNNDDTAGPSDIQKDAEVTLFLNDDGKVRFAIATKYTGTDAVITDLTNTSSSGVAYISLDTYADNKYDGNMDVKLKVDSDTKFTLNGKEVTYKDLAKGQIVSYVATSDSVKYGEIVDASNTTVKGKVEKKSSKSGDYTATVDGKAYTLTNSYSYDKVKVGEEFEFYLNVAGKVVVVKQLTGTASDDQEGFFVKYDNYTEINNGRGTAVTDVILVAADGTVKSLRNATVNDDTYKDNVGNVVSVSFNDDNEVATIKDVGTPDGPKNLDDINTTTRTITVSDPITSATTKYRYTSDTVVYNAAAGYDAGKFTGDAEDVKVIPFADLKEGWDVKVFAEDGYVSYIVVTDDNGASSDAKGTVAGVFLDRFSDETADGTAYYVTLNVSGESVDVEITKDLYTQLSTLKAGDPLALVDSNKNGSFGKDEIGTFATVTNVDVDNKKVTAGTNTYKVTSDTVIYYVTYDGTDLDTVDLAVLDQADLATTTVKVLPLLDENGNPVTIASNYEASVIIIQEK
ncbi:exported hypothetical protein [[Clostridium] ultunense Esp]|nr:exported hypothetical protein [[Clostridium] ultunense Esp]